MESTGKEQNVKTTEKDDRDSEGFYMCSDSADDKQVYHEKQKLGHCAIHTLNDLFQKQMYTVKMFDEICIELTQLSVE